MSLTAGFRKFTPLLNRVLVQKLEPLQKTKSGIILSSKEANANVGKVIAVGEGHRAENGSLIPVSLKVGSTVVLPDFSGTKIELNNGEFFLFRDTEIIGVLEDPIN